MFFKSVTKHIFAHFLWKDSEIGFLRVGACFKHLKIATAVKLMMLDLATLRSKMRRR